MRKRERGIAEIVIVVVVVVVFVVIAPLSVPLSLPDLVPRYPQYSSSSSAALHPSAPESGFPLGSPFLQLHPGCLIQAYSSNSVWSGSIRPIFSCARSVRPKVCLGPTVLVVSIPLGCKLFFALLVLCFAGALLFLSRSLFVTVRNTPCFQPNSSLWCVADRLSTWQCC